MPFAAYGLALVPGVLALVALAVGGPAPWLVPALLFGLVPALELCTRGDRRNASPDAERHRRQSAAPELLLFAIVPLQVGIVLSLMSQVAGGGLTGWALPGAVLAAGMGCGAYGINVAHELGHRPTRHHRLAARVLLLTTLYMHFTIEHNRGHHARVATPDDPATARRGQTVYAFWLRSVVGSWRSAWALEDRRLRRFTHPRLRFDNEMTRGTLIQLAALALALIAFGPLATACWVGASLVGVLLLETVNYIEHYGLQREARPDGRYERVQPHHSWNSDLPVGRLLLFELTRHSDHHAFPARPFPVLRHHAHAPQLPTGYPGMVLLSLFPPAFFRVMDRQLSRERDRLQAAA